jgi:hypothetical protein
MQQLEALPTHSCTMMEAPFDLLPAVPASRLLHFPFRVVTLCFRLCACPVRSLPQALCPQLLVIIDATWAASRSQNLKLSVHA